MKLTVIIMANIPTIIITDWNASAHMTAFMPPCETLGKHYHDICIGDASANSENNITSSNHW